jgi:hypothetical protein
MLYTLFIVLDNFYQLCFIAARYNTAGVSFSFSVSVIVSLGSLATMSGTCIALAFVILLIVSAFVLLIFKNSDWEYY